MRTVSAPKELPQELCPGFVGTVPPVSSSARSSSARKLCLRAAAGSRRFYAPDKFTPLQVRQDEAHPNKTTKIFYGGKRRKVRYKEVAGVYWQRGAKQRPLRLILVAATPYRKSQSKRLYYREPAYLLTTDLHSSLKQLLQIYFDRWQIEVNHREEKDTLGVGQAQLWNATSVPKQPVLAVAAYSALLLASLIAFGAERGAAYASLPCGKEVSRDIRSFDVFRLRAAGQRRARGVSRGELRKHAAAVAPIEVVLHAQRQLAQCPRQLRLPGHNQPVCVCVWQWTQ